MTMTTASVIPRHRAFDEATAILAGDALQVLAFHILAREAAIADGATARAQLIAMLADASGTEGMAGGQALDLAAVGRTLTIVELEDIHRRKTGALIRASVLMGAAVAAESDTGRLARLRHFGDCIGLAFQIQDDILDVEGDPATLGKSTGADRAKDKPTYPSVAGMAQAKSRCRELHAEAVAALADFGAGGEILRWLADFVIERES
jgi:farnesyl diphosphate synthase